MSEDKKKALLNYVQVLTTANPAPVTIKLRGLDPAARYSVEGMVLTGAALMYAGIRMPKLPGDHQALQLEITAV